ncbi:MAG: Fe-S cluster assembly protein SufD [Bradymonadia bacterium]
MAVARDVTVRAEAQAHLLGLFQAADEPQWLQDRRLEGVKALEATGLPQRRSEDWKYTNIGPWLETRYALGDGAGVDALPADLAQGARLVFVDGRFRADLSDEISGVTAGALSAHLDRPAVQDHLGRHAAPQGFVALNQGTFTDGALIEVAPNTQASAPINLVHLSTGEGRAAGLRHLVVLGQGAEAEVVIHERTTGSGPSLTHVVVEIALGDNAGLELVDLQEGGPEAFYTAHMAATLGRDARLSRRALALGGRSSRAEVVVNFGAEGGEADLNGLYLARGRSHQDHHLTLNHAHSRCTSGQLYKGILDEHGRGVFTGKVVVAEHTHQSKAEQGNHNLLLSNDAHANTRPQLEIYADDVQCSHGATVGQLDEEAMFYLRARGIGVARARDLLTYAFASEVIGNDATGAWLESRLLGWLPGHTVAAVDLHAALEEL